MSIGQTTSSLTIEVDDERTLDRVVRALNTNEYLKDRAKDRNRPSQPGNLQRNNQTNRSTVTIEIPFEDETR
jgi:hypothetical protein